jgi:hypothetical protein
VQGVCTFGAFPAKNKSLGKNYVSYCTKYGDKVQGNKKEDYIKKYQMIKGIFQVNKQKSIF